MVVMKRTVVVIKQNIENIKKMPYQLMIIIFICTLFSTKLYSQTTKKLKKGDYIQNENSKYFVGKWAGIYERDTITINLKVRQKTYFKLMDVFVDWIFGEVYINSIKLQSNMNKEDTSAIINGLVNNKMPFILGATFNDMNLYENYFLELKKVDKNTLEWKIKLPERVSVSNNYTRPKPSVPIHFIFKKQIE